MLQELKRDLRCLTFVLRFALGIDLLDFTHFAVLVLWWKVVGSRSLVHSVYSFSVIFSEWPVAVL